MSERLSDQELAALTTQLNRSPASAGPFISPMTILRLIDEVGERRAREAAGPHYHQAAMTELRHVCGYCGPGYLSLATPSYPAKTDWCAICGHRGEGVEREVIKHKWGGYRLHITIPPKLP